MGLVDHFFAGKPAPSNGDGKRAIERLAEIRGSREWRSAREKIRASGSKAELTAGERKILEAEQFNEAVDHASQPKRQDRREYDGQPQSPGLPEKSTEPRATSWALAVARADAGFVRRSLAQETLTKILSGKHEASRAYFDPADPEHQVTVQNAYSLREIANDNS